MTCHSMKQFRLAATLLVALGLGFTQTLPVQASAVGEFADSSILEKNYQFNLEDSTLTPSQSVKNKPSAAVVQAGETGSAIGNFSTKTNSSAANRSQAKQSQKESGDAGDNRFFPFALIAIIAVIIYNLFSRGGRTAAAQPTPRTTPSTQTTTGPNDPATLPSPPSQVEQEPPAPVAVPTPALLPGLLGMGLKLMRQKKVHSQTAPGLEAS